MKKVIIGILVALTVIVLLLPGCSTATAQAPSKTAQAPPVTSSAPAATTSAPTSATSAAAEFYKGKTITIFVPSTPGGTFDLISRTMAPYLEKYTGASTQIVNSTTIDAENKLAASKPDGLSVELSGHGPKTITANMFKQPGVAFDWTKFVLLGRIPFSSTAIAVNKSLGWTKVTDPVGKNWILAASTPFFEPLFAEALGWDTVKVVPGFSGGDKPLAIRRGEVQGAAFGAAQVSQNADFLVPLVTTIKDDKGFPGVPAVTDVAAQGREKWAQWTAAWDSVMYWSVAAPGTPQDRADYLEAALFQMYNDPAFRADMAKIKIDLSPQFVTSKQLYATTAQLATISPADVQSMQDAINNKYVK